MTIGSSRLGGRVASSSGTVRNASDSKLIRNPNQAPTEGIERTQFIRIAAAGAALEADLSA